MKVVTKKNLATLASFCKFSPTQSQWALCLLAGGAVLAVWLEGRSSSLLEAGSVSACSLRRQRAEGSGSLRGRQGAAQNPPAILALCLGKFGVVWLAGTEVAQIYAISF